MYSRNTHTVNTVTASQILDFAISLKNRCADINKKGLFKHVNCPATITVYK